MMPGNYGEKVGIIGAGMIGKLSSHVKNFHYKYWFRPSTAGNG